MARASAVTALLVLAAGARLGATALDYYDAYDSYYDSAEKKAASAAEPKAKAPTGDQFG